jgi:hypothetical protein
VNDAAAVQVERPELLKRLGQSRDVATPEFNRRMDELVQWVRSNTAIQTASDGTQLEFQLTGNCACAV